jgi:hypothetical protein
LGFGHRDHKEHKEEMGDLLVFEFMFRGAGKRDEIWISHREHKEHKRRKNVKAAKQSFLCVLCVLCG